MLNIEFILPDPEHGVHGYIRHAEAVRYLDGPQPGPIGVQHQPSLRLVLLAVSPVELQPDRSGRVDEDVGEGGSGVGCGRSFEGCPQRVFRR